MFPGFEISSWIRNSSKIAFIFILLLLILTLLITHALARENSSSYNYYMYNYSSLKAKNIGGQEANNNNNQSNVNNSDNSNKDNAEKKDENKNEDKGNKEDKDKGNNETNDSNNNSNNNNQSNVNSSDNSNKNNTNKEDENKSGDKGNKEDKGNDETNKDNGNNGGNKDKGPPEQNQNITDFLPPLPPVEEKPGQVITPGRPPTTIIQPDVNHEEDKSNGKENKEEKIEDNVTDKHAEGTNIENKGPSIKEISEDIEENEKHDKGNDKNLPGKPDYIKPIEEPGEDLEKPTGDTPSELPGVTKPVINEPPQQEPLPNENKTEEICSCDKNEWDASGGDALSEFCIKTCEGIKEELLSNSPFTNNIPRGSIVALNSFITIIRNGLISNEEDIREKISSVVLYDSDGNKYNIGVALFIPFSQSIHGEYESQNTYEIDFLNLVALVKIPENASEGNATISILSGEKQLTNMAIKITSPKKVRIGKKSITKPHIRDPIIAKLVKSNDDKFELVMRIKGKNFIRKTAVIDNVLQKLLDKTSYFTSIVFAPGTGINIKQFEVLNTREIILTAEITSDITPGLKLFNIITPVGTDIGGVIIPDNLSEGMLETTTDIQRLIDNKSSTYLNNVLFTNELNKEFSE